jgi:hypothetical protein
MKMKLKQIASNMTEIEIHQPDALPYYVLFSYSTPVAGRSDVGVFKTAKKYSRTTTKHINKYFREEWGINPLSVKEVDQAYIDGLVK